MKVTLNRPLRFALLALFFLRSPSVAQVAESIDRDLAKALEQLASQRATIAEEKIPLAKETNFLAAELTQKRREVRLIELDRTEHQQEVKTLTERNDQLESEFIYIDNLLLDFRKQFESCLPAAELDVHRPKLLEAEHSLNARLELLSDAIDLLQESLGIRTFSGEALDENGTASKGIFLQAGPICWFISSDRKQGGLTAENRNLLTELISNTADLKELGRLLDGQAAAPRFDPTQGSAIVLNKAEGSWIDHVKQGGFWIYPILFLALIAALSALGKSIQLARIKNLQPDIIRNVLNALKEDDRLSAETALAKVRHPAKALLQRGIELSNRATNDIEEGMYEKFLETEPSLNCGLSFIAIASATAPLLGLLGTVTGMIYTFRLINVFGTGDAKSLASGISEALVTTEMGLVVAIPALIMHALLSRRVQGIRSSMELASLAFVNGLTPKGEK